ncbi:MAG: hypothetical protein ABFD83_14770 [Armatimonadota bacterium]
MSDRYQLQLDIPYDVLIEEGYQKSRLCKDLRTGRSLQIGSNCMLEPKTGTLMLKPLNLDPVAWYSPSTDGLRLHAAAMSLAADCWHEHPQVLPANSGTHSIMSTGGANFGLINTLLSVAIADLPKASLESGHELVPVIVSKDSYPVNQGYHLGIESTAYFGTFAHDYLGFKFGDFMLRMHTDGGTDLMWSTDGSCDPSHWVHVKEFGTFADPKGMSSSIIGFIPNAAMHLYIIPFGRGNILFMMQSGGKIFHDVYTHHEATIVDNTYQITKAGKFGVYVDGNDSHAVKLSVSLIGYPTSGTFTDTQDQLPYFPTQMPLVTEIWSRTYGTPAVTSEVLDADGNAFVADGTRRTFKTKLTLSGDGTCTPWVDGYHLVFPELVGHRTPTVITIPESKILSLRIEDGKDWDSQTLTAEVMDDFTDSAISDLTWRTRLNGKLVIDGVDYMRVMFSKPKTTCRRQYNRITLTGVNYGVFRLTKKRFLWSASYGNLSVTDALNWLLRLCGFPDEKISIEACATLLPQSSLQGQDTDDPKEKDSPGFKSQPEPNTPVREFFEYIIENFSPHWLARYRGNGYWQIGADTTPTSSQGVIQKLPTLQQIMNGEPWMSEEYEIEAEPPECNSLYVIGKTDKGDTIANEAVNPISIECAENPKPLSYVGERDQAVLINFDLNTMAALNDCLTKMATEGFRPYITVSWRGPFNSDLAIGTRWTLEGVCDVEIVELSTDAESIKALETTESTTYTGRVIL